MFILFSVIQTKFNLGDEFEFLERVFLLATITIETDSITIKMLRSFFVSIETPYRIIEFLLKTPARSNEQEKDPFKNLRHI